MKIEIGQWVNWTNGKSIMRGLFMKADQQTATVMVRIKDGIPHAITAQVPISILNAEPLV